MNQITVRKLWTGQGSLIENAVVSISRSGLIEEISPGAAEEPFDHPFGMPAFFDAHCHLSWMVLKELSVDLSSAGSADELLDIVRENIRNNADFLLRGESFDESSWENSSFPTLKELDAVTGDRPVFLCRICGHAGLVNSAMMALMKEDSRWINRSSGVMREKPVLEFSSNFPPDPHKALNAVSSVIEGIHAAGVTGVCTIEKAENASLLVQAEPELDVELVINGLAPEELIGSGLNSAMLKLFLDGSFGAGSASIDMNPQPSLLLTDAELLDTLVRCGWEEIMPVVHAIGGGALSQLDRISAEAFRSLGRTFPIRIEHAEDLFSAWPGSWNPDVHLFSMQPNFVQRWQRQGGMYDQLVSPGRSRRMNPFRTVLENGFRLGFGSDSMPLNPLYGLSGAVNHRDPSQSLSMDEALRAYTLDAAGISGCRELAGPLEPGRRADMVFLSVDPFSDMAAASVVRTVRMGQTVFSSEESKEHENNL